MHPTGRCRPDLLAAADQAEARLVAAYEGREGSALSVAAEAFVCAYQMVGAAFVAEEAAMDPPAGARPNAKRLPGGSLLHNTVQYA